MSHLHPLFEEILAPISPAQTQVNECAREYTRLVQERNDRLEKAIIEAQMWLSLGEYSRVQSILFQVLNS